MDIVLIILGAVLTGFGVLFTYRFLNIRKSFVKASGRVIDSKKVAQNGRIPGGYQAVVEYQVGKKRTRGYSLIPGKAKYANGYKLNIYYNKNRPDNFLIGAYFTAMKLYCIALPAGILCIVGGILMMVL